jgi:hypothetical protein
MSELAAAEDKKETPEELFYRLMEQLPENMRLYQELVEKRNNLYEERRSSGSIVANIDIDAPPESHPEEGARDALGVYVADRRLRAVEKQLQELDDAGESVRFVGLQGRKVRVEPLGAIHKIATIARGNNYIGGTKRSKTGTLTELRLRPSEGGVIEFKTRFSGDSHLSAHPIFDRHGQEPQFKIELLD